MLTYLDFVLLARSSWSLSSFSCSWKRFLSVDSFASDWTTANSASFLALTSSWSRRCTISIYTAHRNVCSLAAVEAASNYNSNKGQSNLAEGDTARIHQNPMGGMGGRTGQPWYNSKERWWSLIGPPLWPLRYSATICRRMSPMLNSSQQRVSHIVAKF